MAEPQEGETAMTNSYSRFDVTPKSPVEILVIGEYEKRP
jgi:hypothetical protein